MIMRIGVPVSAAAHAAVLALAVHGPPWLRPHPGYPAPVVEVSLVTAAALAAAEAPPAAAVPLPAAPPPAPALKPPPEEAETDAKRLDEVASLAPAFDPEHPFGPGDPVATLAGPQTAPTGLAPATAARPRPRP